MKKLIIGIVVGIIVGMLGTAYASNIGDDKKITIYTDEETKIQYIIVEASGSYVGEYSVGICPRYTSNGNLYYVGSKIVEQDDIHDSKKQKMYSLQ